MVILLFRQSGRQRQTKLKIDNLKGTIRWKKSTKKINSKTQKD